MSEPVRPDTSDLAAVHRVFRTTLATAPDVVGRTLGDEDQRAVVASYFANLLAFLEVHHQGEELLVFPKLAERAPDGAAVVARAEAQHLDVEAGLQAAAAALAAWDSDAGAAPLVGSLQALEAVLVPHLDQEEDDIPALAAACMTAEEWGMLPGHAMAHFGGDKVWLVLGLIREQFTEAQRAMMLGAMPPPARQMWETTGEASFTAMVATVRGGS